MGRARVPGEGRRRRQISALAVVGGAALACLAGCSTPAVNPPAPTVVVTVPASTPAAASTTPSAAASPMSTPADGGLTPPNCPTSSLRVDLGPAEGAMGTTYRPLVFTNTGPTACQLRGFPGVSWVAGDDGHQVGPAATEDGPRADQANLGPNESAHATLAISNAGNYDTARCRPTDVRGLRVYPPGDTASAYIPDAGRQACAGDVVTLKVRTMQPGPS